MGIFIFWYSLLLKSPCTFTLSISRQKFFTFFYSTGLPSSASNTLGAFVAAGSGGRS
jgi:hypothetical protein